MAEALTGLGPAVVEGSVVGKGGCSRGLALTPLPHLALLLLDVVVAAVHTPCSTTILPCGSSMLRRGRPAREGERERQGLQMR